MVNSEDVFLVIDKGNRVRSTAVTDGNARSSRSHAIFMVGVTVVNDTDGITRTSDLYLVDLAGSEKVQPLLCLNDFQSVGPLLFLVCAVVQHCCRGAAPGSC